MENNWKYYGMILFLFIGCREAKPDFSRIDEEIKNLASTEEKRQYLENLFKDDQKSRQGQGSEIMLKYGENSKEYNDFVKNRISKDSINLVKVERYFRRYGHPKKDKVGEIAAQTPWAVIHHAKSYETRDRNFTYLYGTYINGDIDDGAFSMYLGRMYQFKNGERFQIKSPYKSEDKINQLIIELDLEERKWTPNTGHNIQQ